MSLHSSSKNDTSNKSAYLKLINLVQIHPILYNRKELILDSQSFRQNQKLINHSWLQIASELKISVGECKRRWKFLKETFLRVQKRNSQNSGDINKKWIYEEALSFLSNSKIEKPKTEIPKMENIITVHSESGEVEEGTVEYIELDMDTMGDSEYYIMTGKEHGEVIEIATPIQGNQIVLNDKTIQKYISISNDSNLENATFVNIEDLDKNNFIIATSLVEDENVEKYIIDSGTVKEKSLNGVEKHIPIDKKIDSEATNKLNKKLNKLTSEDNEISKRINELLQLPESQKNLDIFFQNIAKVVSELPEYLQLEVRKTVCNIVLQNSKVK